VMILMGHSPSKGYKIGMLLVLLCAIALLVFMVVTGTVSILKGALITLVGGSLIYYYALPIFVRRPDYIGSGPKLQPVNVNITPYLVFVLMCLVTAGVSWYANV